MGNSPLDFGIGLLNLGNTLGTTFALVFDNNGIGKAYSFPYLNCNITLPAVFLEFKGQKNGKIVDLTWTTLTEDNVNHFELQQSTDGGSFQTIAVIFSKGEQQNTYMFPDRHPYAGNNYYRLKVIDKNGQTTYSNTILIRFDDKLPADVIVAPNPAQSEIKLRLVGLDAGVYNMELRNSGGQLIKSKTVNVNQYNQFESIKPAANMPAGVYWLNVYNRNNNQVVKTIRVFYEQ